MMTPTRPATIDELGEQIRSGAFVEGHAIECKESLPEKRDNWKIARQIAALAVDGGVLMYGVAERDGGLTLAPIDCNGARERVEQIARDIPDPPVDDARCHVLAGGAPGWGVLWVEVPPSAQMLHQVRDTYYKRDGVRTRPMGDAEIEARMALRRDRARPIQEQLEMALKRTEPEGSLHARTCVVARPVGSARDEFFRATSTPETWEAFAYGLFAPDGPVTAPAPVRFWGLISAAAVSDVVPSALWQPSMYRDVEFEESGAFCHLSYSRGPDRQGGDAVHPWLALNACREATGVIGEIHRRTGRRLAWDLAFRVSGVKGHLADSWPRFGRPGYPPRFRPPFPHDVYEKELLGVSAWRLEADAKGIVRDLTARFIGESGLDFVAEYPST